MSSSMMDVPDLHTRFSISHAFSSPSSSSMSFFIDSRSWMVAEKTTQQILSVIQPTIDSENRRKEIIDYLEGLFGNAFGIKVYLCGSVPLKTYLPHGDVDLTAITCFETSPDDLASKICNLLKHEEKNNHNISVKDVLYVPAQVRVVKCIVGDIAVDISFNQTSGLSALYFLEQVDHVVGKDHLFKLSVILIKAWCYYESRLLGGFHGLISTYALEIMVIHVINIFHSLLHCPLAVLYTFLEYYNTFDWNNYCIAVHGRIPISSLPEKKVAVLHGHDELLMTEEFVWNCREAFLPPTGAAETKIPFPVKFLNIMDPLKDDNNLGRSVSKGNFYRIKSALAYGCQRLGDILILPPEEIRAGLEKFFKNTLERNGKGTRVDVLVPVLPYGSETSTATNNVNIDLLSGIHYGLWFNGYGYGMLSYPVWPVSSASGQIWNIGWGSDHEVGPNFQYDPNPYCVVEETQSCPTDTARLPVNHFMEEIKQHKPRKKPFSTSSPSNFGDKGKPRGVFSPSSDNYAASMEEKPKLSDLQHNNAASSSEEKKKSRRSVPFLDNSKTLSLTNAGSLEESRRPIGSFSSVYNQGRALRTDPTCRSSATSAYIHPFEQPMQEDVIFEDDGVKEHEHGKEHCSETLDSQASTPEHCNVASDVGESSCSIKYSVDDFPMLPRSKPIVIRSPPVTCLHAEHAKETSVSFDNSEFWSCRPSPPTSLSISEAGKQSDGSDVSVFLDALSELTISVAISEDRQSHEGKKMVSVEPLHLTDESEFPPLPSYPRKPVVSFSIKEFPPLRACQKLQKKNRSRR